MSQETTNTFSDGLIMDLNPLTTPNNVLTNCLNGTFITFNGNEFVLQNDMGNGRVETAYLPSGYVPVGIKEHGGIIYVASYNPLTNRGLIGSFPSPERNISSEELNTFNNSLNWELFWNGSSNNILNFTVARILISSNIVRSGDKFSIMFEANQFNELSKWISNFNNVTSDGLIKYRHNKLLTIQVATEDSSGNLVNITDTLKRTQTIGDESNVVIEFDSNTLPLIKFNSGYFIQEYTAGDSNDLTRFRQSKALNTYNNKIFGNLYLIATLNTVTYYNVALFGYTNESKSDIEVELPDGRLVTIGYNKTITCTEVEYQYNCPDGYCPDTVDNITDFPSDYCPTSEFDPNKVLGGTLMDALFWDEPTKVSDEPTNTWSLEFPINEYLNEGNYYHPNYNDTTNLYTLKEILLGNVNENDGKLLAGDGLPRKGILQYNLTPYMTYGKLDGLTTIASLNLELIGSGTTDLTVWKYYINQNNVDVTWGFSSYPLYLHEVKGVLFEFKELSQASDTLKNYALYISGRESYNGVFTNSVPLKVGNIYVVKITVFLGPIGTNMSINLQKGDLDSDIIVSEDKELPDSIIETIFWRTLICDLSYNLHYSNTKDMTKDVKGIDINLVGNTSVVYTRDNLVTWDEINLSYTQPTLELGYEIRSTHNKVNLNLNYHDIYLINNSLFELDPDHALILDHTILNGTVLIDNDLNVITDKVTFNAEYILKTHLSSENPDEIAIGTDSLTILLDIPMYYDYTSYSKFVQSAYRPLKANSKHIIGSEVVKDLLYYTLPWWKSGNNRSDRTVDCYMMPNIFKKLFFKKSSDTNDHASFKVDGVDKFNWGYSTILGEAPAIVFVSSNGDPRTNIRKGLNGVEYEHILIYAKSTGGGYHMILFSRSAPIRNNDLNKISWSQVRKERIDSMSGDPLAMFNDIFLERIYTYLPYNNTVTYYGMYGSKYINDINTQCQVNYKVTSNGYFIKYKNILYTDANIGSCLDLIDKSILINNEFIKDSLTPNIKDVDESYSVSIPLLFTGSYVLYNLFLNKMTSLNEATIAIVDYHNRTLLLQESDNSPLVQNYWYYLYDINTFDYNNPEIYNFNSEIGLTKVPTWLDTYFELVDGIPLIYPNYSLLAYHDFWISKASENHDHGWNMSEVLVNSRLCSDPTFPQVDDLLHEMMWMTTDIS